MEYTKCVSWLNTRILQWNYFFLGMFEKYAFLEMLGRSVLTM
jgi:hypothetical protein